MDAEVGAVERAPRSVAVEVCVEDVAGLALARAAGAERVELCTALALGGLTPSVAMLEACVRTGGVDLTVLVRPRPGDFLYASEELAVLARDVELARAAGANGVALGCLTPEGEVDAPALATLMARVGALRVTFHRAFDYVRAPERALEALIELGVARVLTSGQSASAFEGRARIAALVRAARGRIEVVAAGGVRAANARALVESTGVRVLHLSAAKPCACRKRHVVPDIHLGRRGDDDIRTLPDFDELRALVATLRA
jgi:copper homeostasis protein